MKNSYILGAACTVLFALGNSAAYAAPTYSVLVESDPGGLGNLNYGEFASLTDVKNWNVSSSHSIGQNLFGTGVSVRGFAYDGSKYHVLVESDPGGLGNLNLGTFDTLTDLKNWNVSSSHSIGQNLFGTGVSVGGFTAVSSVPLPATTWLIGTALISLIGFSKRRRLA